MNGEPQKNEARERLLGAPIRILSLSLLSYLRARLELAGLEGKEAVARLGGILFLAAVAITLSIAGYLLLCLALVFGVAHFFGDDRHIWILIAATTGAVHLLIAWGILRGARSWLQKPMFANTLEEFRKDDSWLRSTTEKPL